MSNWGTWSLLSAAALGSFGFLLSGEVGDRTLLVPGPTSSGHHQLEADCDSCHGAAFAGNSALEASCVRCHGAQLDAAGNAHPKRVFTDPRNAERVALLDARRCVTCHREHWPEGTGPIGVTVAPDHCGACHADIGRERASHAGLPFTGCADTGCHKFHDNEGLYEELLVAHAGEPWLLAERRPPIGELAAVSPAWGPASNAASHATSNPTSNTALPAHGEAPPRPLTAADRDAPVGHVLAAGELSAWAASAHARGGVNCQGCHAVTGEWSDRVSERVCGRCHVDERAGWVSGKHGVRPGLGLGAMRPELAQLPMRAAAHGEELSCTSCHGAHGFDRERAAVEACQHCHSDAHTEAYAESPHGLGLARERAGAAPPGSAVSCATCHMPEVDHPSGRRLVQHDQNANLRPREKMLRGVCMQCHGLAFSIDALADAALVASNFSGQPRIHVPSIDWALARAEAARPSRPPTPPTPRRR